MTSALRAWAFPTRIAKARGLMGMTGSRSGPAGAERGAQVPGVPIPRSDCPAVSTRNGMAARPAMQAAIMA